MWCIFNNPGPPWTCSECGWTHSRHNGEPILVKHPPRHLCPNAPDILEAADKLDITGDDIKHWAQALARWTVAGFPTRTQVEVERIEAEHCRPCKQYVKGKCKLCKCNVNKSRVPVTNKIKMGSENCPLEKW